MRIQGIHIYSGNSVPFKAKMDYVAANGLSSSTCLKSNFNQTLKKLGIENPEPEFEKFLQAYQSPDRYYHGIKHIENMLKDLDEFQKTNSGKIENPELLRFGIFFHDFINGEPNDEQKSVQIAVDILEKSTKSISIHKLKDIIMATKHSRLLEQSATFEELLIRDLDLGILGSPREIYNQYSNAIRKEYNTVPYQIFAAKRIKVLESFLNKDRIYSTDYFYNKYENQARINLTDERRQLTASI